jgi:hypothetical protein
LRGDDLAPNNGKDIGGCVLNRRSLLSLLVLSACGNPPTTPARPNGTLQIVSGNGQATTAGYQLHDTIVVRLQDSEGAPVAFAPIHAGTGAVLSEVLLIDALTHADGTARLVWRLGLSVGSQELTVTTGANVEVEPLTITAEARSQPFRDLAGDDSVLCAVDMAGQLGCWRPLASVDHAPQWAPAATTERFVALAVHRLTGGERRGCAASVTGRIWCFDVTADGVVSNMSELPGTHAPVVRVSTASGVLSRDPPFCGLTDDGTALCWGGNAWGVLGDGTDASRDMVMPVFTVMRFRQIFAGSYHACATALDGTGWCWGRNHLSQLGILPSPIPVAVPVQRPGLLRFKEVLPVPGHASCGVVRDNGGVYCWGAKEATGIGEVAMSLIDDPSFSFPVFATGASRDNTLAAVDDATIVLGSDGESSWWGRLDPGVEQVIARAARPFLHQLPITSLVPGHFGGLLCGTARGSNAFLCGRMMTLTGYPSHQLHPELSGFGMPQP